MTKRLGYMRAQDGTYWRVAPFGTITIIPTRHEWRVLIEGCYYSHGKTLRKAMNAATHAWVDHMNGTLRQKVLLKYQRC